MSFERGKEKPEEREKFEVFVRISWREEIVNIDNFIKNNIKFHRMQKDAGDVGVGDGVKKEVRVNNLWWWPGIMGLL